LFFTLKAKPGKPCNIRTHGLLKRNFSF